MNKLLITLACILLLASCLSAQELRHRPGCAHVEDDLALHGLSQMFGPVHHRCLGDRVQHLLDIFSRKDAIARNFPI